MTSKRKIMDKIGVQVFPITHTKAVIDDNGNSVEQRLQENLDVINQKQLEVGAVPSDITPTAGSTNWVTSGGVAAKTQVYDSVIDNVQSVNLFDKTQIIQDRYVRYDNGKAVSTSGTGYFCTDYIPIDSDGAYAALGVASGYRGYACYSDKSESAYTHGAIARQAVYQDGDAYVRFTGKMEDVDRFMVVKGTSADYPNNYVPFGLVGELKEGTVGAEQMVNGSVTHEKLSTESVNEVNLSEQYWNSAPSIYGNTVKELFFLGNAIPKGVSIIVHFYNGRVIFEASLNDEKIWGIERNFENNYFYNDVVYPLKCSTSNIDTISVGDIVGYIVFANIDAAKALYDGIYRTVNIARVKYLLNNPTIATQTYNIKDREIVTGMIAENAVSFNKIGFKSVAVISKNFLNENDSDFKHEHGYYVRCDNGNTGYTPVEKNLNYGHTGFIPVSKKGLYFNAFIYSGVAAGAVYDKNKVYIRALLSATYIYQEGDGYVRWTLAENPISPYTEGQYMIWEGDSSVKPEYDEYEAKDVIDPDVLFTSEATIQDGSISEAKLSAEVRNSIAGIGVEICIPDEIPCVVGDTLRIYFRSIVKAPNPYIWDIIAVSTVGKSYPRYYEYKPTAAGNKSVTFYVRNAKMKVLAQKTITLRCINHISSPSSNKNILMVGASMLQDGTITYELNRRLTSNTGDGTPYNPTGLGLSNITFVGRKTGLSYPSIHLEHNSGWSWYDYATIGRFAYRFFVVGQAGIDVHPGAIYSGAGTLKFTVSQTDIDIDRETGTGYFTCTYSGSGTQPASGTLTLFEGEGDATITYNSFTLDSGNPFWNDTTQSLDFISYANNYCNGSIDILLCFFGMNDFTAVGENGISGRIENYVKPFIRAFHEQFPNNIFVICTLYLGSVNGGMAASYGASSTWNYYTAARKTWKWSELVRELAADEEFSSYVKVIDTNSSFDAENLYPTGNRIVANRSEDTEVVQTNGVHTTTNGKKSLADGMFEGLNMILQ